ncbi:hypothetical protein F5888DRAFT_1620330 [Russula emetica]|nr:hypothetical protein F5888DRAFT_1620330 [Russula emetica]
MLLLARSVPSAPDFLLTFSDIGHYNLFDRGILHRDISSGNVLRYSEPVRRSALDKFECTRNVNYCQGFLIDGDHAIKWREFSGSQSISGTIPFMSMRLLDAWQVRGTIIHTALDDLESFLWVLIWGIVHASKVIEGAKIANEGIQLMLDAWSGDVNCNRTKYSTVEISWKDAVFGDLIQEWFNTFRLASRENNRITEDMSIMDLGSQEWDDACDELESYCKDIYKEVLESGFRYLEGVRGYSDWDKVVAANVRRFVRVRRS